MKTSGKALFILAIILIFSSCFSDWKGDAGTFSISIGGSGGGRTALPWAPYIDSNALEHVITLEGPGPEQTETVTGAETVSFSVVPGVWNITIKAYNGEVKDENLTADGYRTADIKPGPNDTIEISMGEPLNEEGEITWNGHRYVLYGGGKSWTSARDYCESKGGHLVTITSPEEQEAVYGLVRDYGAKNMYWIGAYRPDTAVSTRDLRWVTGEPWGYENWASNEPNGLPGGEENYVQMYRLGTYATPGKWNDGENNGDPIAAYFFLGNTGFICEW